MPKKSSPRSAARKSVYIGLAVVLASVVAGAAFFALKSALTSQTDSARMAQLETGRRIYAEACAACHGASLEGQANWQKRLPNGRMPAPPHDALGHTWHHSDEVLFRITKDGPAAYPAGYQTDMLAFGGRLTDEEITATLAFIKSTWPPEVRAKQERIDLDSQRRKP
ncbi:MAG: cytochrome c [Reyranella sp.]|nr:cytochrome c [Reyranella sp.]